MKNLPDEKQSTEQPSALKIAERLFERFSYMYGNKFLDMWANVDQDKLIEAWADEISGYSLEELKRGVDSCKTREWPPTMPEFLKICRPLINHESAFREAQLNIVKIERNEQPEWSSRAVYWAKVQFGHFDLKNSNYQQAKKRWDSMLDELLEDERDNGLPEIPNIEQKQLEAPGKTQISREEAEKRVKEIGMSLGDGQRDMKDWARKILDNPKGRPSIAIQFAKEALGIVDQPQEATA